MTFLGGAGEAVGGAGFRGSEGSSGSGEKHPSVEPWNREYADD